MKWSQKLWRVYVTLGNLCKFVLVTGLENRLLAPLLGVRIYGNEPRPPTTKKPRARFSGTVRDYGHFIQCDEIFVDFDLCRVRRKDRDKPRRLRHFEDGFMCMGGAASPAGVQTLPLAELGKWTPARGASTAAVVHQEPVLFVDVYMKWNPALILRQLYRFLHNLEALAIRPENTTLLFFPVDAEDELDALPKKLFNVRDVKDMRGVHLFRNAFYFFVQFERGMAARRRGADNATVSAAGFRHYAQATRHGYQQDHAGIPPELQDKFSGQFGGQKDQQ